MNRVRVVWTGVAGSPYYSNFYSINTATTPPAAHAAVTSLIQALQPRYSVNLTARIEGDVALVESTSNSIVGVNTVAFQDRTGTAAGGLAPLATQHVVRLLTGTFVNGRQVRGRIMLPGVVTASVGPNGQPLAATLTAIDSAFSAYIVGLVNSACVFARASGQAVPISFVDTWEQFGVQRSRRD